MKREESDVLAPAAVSEVCAQLAFIVESGMTLKDGVSALAEERDGMQAVYQALCAGLDETGSLCEAMRRSAAFPAYAVEMTGVGVISMTNVTSAGQLAGVPIIAAAGSLSELAATQLVINLRYSLMSVSLSQKLGRDVGLFDRFVFAFVNTDEVFAVASSKEGKVGKYYMYGLILLPFVGWSVGTLLGASAGSIFPRVVVSCLGVAIYGMFIAIITPVARCDRAVAQSLQSQCFLSKDTLNFPFLLPTTPTKP